jgi:hypothetical protein
MAVIRAADRWKHRRLGLALSLPKRIGCDQTPPGRRVIDSAKMILFLIPRALVQARDATVFHVNDPVGVLVDARVVGDDQDAALRR